MAHRSILERLAQHSERFAPRVESYQKGRLRVSGTLKSKTDLLLRNRRTFFETSLLLILSETLEDDRDEQLDASREVSALLGCLDRFANESLISMLASHSVGIYTRLQNLLEYLDATDGQLDLTTGNEALFVIQTDEEWTAIRRCVRGVEQFLLELEPLASPPSSSVAQRSSIGIRAPFVLEGDQWQFIRTLLDAIEEQLDRCKSSGCESTHRIVYQLLGLPSRGVTSCDISLDTYLYYSDKEVWQNIKYILHE